MKANIKDKVTAIGFTAVLVIVLLVNIFLPDQELSKAAFLADISPLINMDFSSSNSGGRVIGARPNLTPRAFAAAMPSA